mgnify:CR=1 FL=1
MRKIPENIQFRLVPSSEKPEEATKAWEDRTLEEHNVPAEFTLSNFLQTMAGNDKKELEINGQLKVDQAAVDNILSFHPFIKDLTEEQIFTVALYDSYKKSVEKSKKQLELYAEVKLENETKLNIIYAQLPQLKEAIEKKLPPELQPSPEEMTAGVGDVKPGEIEIK